MTNEEKPYPSRLKKKKDKSRSNSILNIMIGLVFALILIIGVSMLFSGGDNQASESEEVAISTGTEQQTSGSEDGESASAGDEDEDAEAKAEEEAAKKAEEEAKAKEEAEKKAEEEAKAKEKEGSVTKGGTITREDSSDPIVEETVINTSWEPVGTKQKGDHVSVYQKDSVDWKEKVNAVSYATGLDPNNMYVMMIKNGGGPQKSIATVQSKDESEKYRVHMEWVDGEGWKPVKMDVLKTLEGAY